LVFAQKDLQVQINNDKIIKKFGDNLMNIWHDIESSRITPEDFIAVVEISKGSKQKYEMDKKTGLLRLDRILYTSTHYPANYGFIPHTLAQDNDPLDVLILCSESLIPMSLVKCYPIGVIIMNDNGSVDEKIIAIPDTDPNYNTYKSINDLPKHIFEEMQHFFSVYKQLENKQTSVDVVSDKNEAIKIIKQSMDTYKIKRYDLTTK
jgi:inorganic pyrophosphatase